MANKSFKPEIFLLIQRQAVVGIVLFSFLNLFLQRGFTCFIVLAAFLLFMAFLYRGSQKYSGKVDLKWFYITFCSYFSLVFLPAFYFFAGGMATGVPLLYILAAVSCALILDGSLAIVFEILTFASLAIVVFLDGYSPSFVERFCTVEAGLQLYQGFMTGFVGISIGVVLRMLIRNYRENRKMSDELIKQLEATSVRDPLSGVYDRKYLINYIENCISDKNAGRIETFSLLMIDIDYFKAINDKYGHLVGDKFIKSLADIISDNLLETETIARYGGEEFICVLPGSSEEEAAQKAERLRKVVSNQTIIPEIPEHITISCGIAEYDSDLDVNQLIALADTNLYSAKRLGRNQVVSAIKQ